MADGLRRVLRPDRPERRVQRVRDGHTHQCVILLHPHARRRAIQPHVAYLDRVTAAIKRRIAVQPDTHVADQGLDYPYVGPGTVEARMCSIVD